MTNTCKRCEEKQAVLCISCAEDLLEPGDWRDAKQDAPMGNTLLLVAVLKSGSRRPEVNIGFFGRDRGWRTRWGKTFDGTVTHWMPLPEVPDEN